NYCPNHCYYWFYSIIYSNCGTIRKTIFIQYLSVISLSSFLYSIFFLLCNILRNLYSNSEKTVKKQVENRRKTAKLYHKSMKKWGSVGNLYFNSDEGMRVWGGDFRWFIFSCNIVRKKN